MGRVGAQAATACAAPLLVLQRHQAHPRRPTAACPTHHSPTAARCATCCQESWCRRRRRSPPPRRSAPIRLWEGGREVRWEDMACEHSARGQAGGQQAASCARAAASLPVTWKGAPPAAPEEVARHSLGGVPSVGHACAAFSDHLGLPVARPRHQQHGSVLQFETRGQAAAAAAAAVVLGGRCFRLLGCQRRCIGLRGKATEDRWPTELPCGQAGCCKPRHASRRRQPPLAPLQLRPLASSLLLCAPLAALQAPHAALRASTHVPRGRSRRLPGLRWAGKQLPTGCWGARSSAAAGGRGRHLPRGGGWAGGGRAGSTAGQGQGSRDQPSTPSPDLPRCTPAGRFRLRARPAPCCPRCPTPRARRRWWPRCRPALCGPPARRCTPRTGSTPASIHGWLVGWLTNQLVHTVETPSACRRKDATRGSAPPGHLPKDLPAAGRHTISLPLP